MFKLRFSNRRNAYTERDVDNYYKQQDTQSRIDKLIADLEKNKCFGLQQVKTIDEAFDFDNSIEIETQDPKMLQLAKDLGIEEADTVKIILDMSEKGMLHVLVDVDGEGYEMDEYSVSFRDYESLLDTIKDGIQALTKKYTSTKKKSSYDDDNEFEEDWDEPDYDEYVVEELVDEVMDDITKNPSLYGLNNVEDVDYGEQGHNVLCIVSKDPKLLNSVTDDLEKMYIDLQFNPDEVEILMNNNGTIYMDDSLFIDVNDTENTISILRDGLKKFLDPIK